MGGLLVGILLSVYGVGAVHSVVYSNFRPGLRTVMFLNYPLDTAAGALIGFFACCWTGLRAWKLVGAAGICWFLLGVIRTRMEGSHTALWELSGAGCVYESNLRSCAYYPIFTTPAHRACSYAIAIGLYLHAGRRKQKGDRPKQAPTVMKSP